MKMISNHVSNRFSDVDELISRLSLSCRLEVKEYAEDTPCLAVAAAAKGHSNAEVGVLSRSDAEPEQAFI